MNAAYNLLLVPQAISFSGALNTTYNHVAGDEYWIFGPTVGVCARVLQKQMTTGMSVSYNVSYNDGAPENKILNLRGSVGYMLLKKHNLSEHRLAAPRSCECSCHKSLYYNFRLHL